MIDKIDLKIIKLLNNNGRYTIREMSTLCNVTEGTIRNRLEELKKDNIIIGYKARIRFSTAGLTEVILGFSIDPQHYVKAVDTIVKNEEVTEVYRTSGDHSVIAVLNGKPGSIDKTIKELESIEGVDAVYPAFVQDIVK